MTAWVARVELLSANLGSLETARLGWFSTSTESRAHWYWIGAIPAMLFLGIVMMPFYYIFQNAFGARLSATALRKSGQRGERGSFGS